MTAALPPPPPPDPPSAPHPFWKVPAAYGYAAAIDAGGTVAAPLLAGFSITFIAFVLPLRSPDSPVPLADVALALLTASALALLGSVQCAFWARQYAVTPSQIMEWWPDLRDGGDLGRWRLAEIRAEQWRAQVLLDLWCGRTRRSYDAGILLLTAAIGCVLWPRHWTAWAAVALIALGFGLLAELAWVFLPTWRFAPDTTRRLFPAAPDVAVRPGAVPTDYAGPVPQP